MVSLRGSLLSASALEYADVLQAVNVYPYVAKVNRTSEYVLMHDLVLAFIPETMIEGVCGPSLK